MISSEPLKMKNFNSEPIDASRLQLKPPSSTDHEHHPMAQIPCENLQQQQPLTVFYNGKVCISQVTDLQAKTILNLARREMEERVRSPTVSERPSPNLQPCQNYMSSPGTGSALSMKRSLQIFLQKRKNRIHSTSPYNR